MAESEASRRFFDRRKGAISWLGAILFSLFFVVTNLYISHKRLLWFDEVNTINVAKLPDLATLWRVQNGFCAESSPIIYNLIVRLFYILSGRAEGSVRFLSNLAMVATMLVVFDCSRRVTDGARGLIAFCVLGSSFLTYYGYEGRPYAPEILFTAIALWLWLHTRADSKPAAVAFGVSIFFAVTMHFQGVLALVPYGLWEVYRYGPWRWPSRKLLAGVAGMFVAFGISFEHMKNSMGWSADSWCPATFQALAGMLDGMFPYGVLVLAVLIVLVCLAGAKAQAMNDTERLCWFFLAIPLVGFVLAAVVTHAYYNRYLIAALPGVAVAFASLVSRYLTERTSMALLLVLCVLMVGRQLKTAQLVDEIEPPATAFQQLHTRKAMAIEDALVADGKSVIISDFQLLDQAQYYSKRPQLYAMYEPDDPRECKCFSSVCMTLDSVESRAQQVAALFPSDKLLTDMAKAGYQATVEMRDRPDANGSVSGLVVYFSRR